MNKMTKPAFLLMELMVAFGLLVFFISIVCRIQQISLFLSRESSHRNGALHCAIQILEHGTRLGCDCSYISEVQKNSTGRQVTVTWTDMSSGDTNSREHIVCLVGK